MGYNSLSELFTATADAIRSKTGGTDPIVANDFPAAIEGISGGGSDTEWIGDGNTHIWISLPDGRTSPRVGVGVSGTVTIDWGDGTAPDTLTGTNAYSVKFTDVHEYREAGNYVITLSVSGNIAILGESGYGSYLLGTKMATSASGDQSSGYRGLIRKVEIGSNVIALWNYAFYNCYALENVFIPDGMTTFGSSAFESCYSLATAVIPDGTTSLQSNMFSACYCLTSVVVPHSVNSIALQAFQNCRTVAYYDFTMHTIVPTISSTSAFRNLSVGCQIRVPAALADEWKAATNWSTYADYIVGVI